MWFQRLGGFLTIVVAIGALAVVSVYDPPVFVQIACALLGSVICLIGVVFLFSEGKIALKGQRG